MPLKHLQHFLIQASSIEETANWYVDVLGMTKGPHPDFKVPVEWLYIGDTDVLHVTTGGADVSENRKRYLGQESQATHGSGVVDHVAFHATGLKEMLHHLQVKEVAYTTRQVKLQGLFQVFLIDPNGVKIELNYDHTEAEGIKPELLAADLPG